MKTAFGLKPLVLGLAAVFTMASVADASAQTRAQRAARKAPQAAAAAAPVLNRERGAAEAPAVVRAANLTCTITDAAFAGGATTNENGVPVSRNSYEVACQDGLGYMLFAPVAPGAGAIQAVDCLALQTGQTTPGTTAPQCRLPGNAQPAQGLRPLVAQAGRTCTINRARYVGTLVSTKATRYEVGCAEGVSFLLDRPESGPVTSSSCLNAADSNAPCQFSTRAELVAALAPLVTQSGRPCTVSDARVAGRSPNTKAEVIEVGCQGAAGFFIETDNSGRFARTMECGRVNNTPCRFTDETALNASLLADYNKRLRAINNDCNVARFVRVGTENVTGREIVEVACSNRPEGAVVAFSSKPGQQSEVYDCLRAGRVSATCTLTQPNLLYPRLTSAIGTRAPRGCQVTNARRMGSTMEGEDWFEVTCSDRRAFAVDYRGNGRVQQVLTCRNAAFILGGCQAGESGSVPKQ
jgi:hypothetical protein